jgi:long-chain acyl-CoA synthetase
MTSKPWHQHYDYSVPTSIRYPRLPASDIYQIPCGSFPDKPALNFYGTEMTFWQMRSQIRRMANAMGSAGIGKGDRVGIHLPNCPQFIIAYIATLSLGAIVVNMNPLYTPDELKFIITDTDMGTIITFDWCFQCAPGAEGHRVERVIVTGLGLHKRFWHQHAQGSRSGRGVAALFHDDRERRVGQTARTEVSWKDLR